MVLLWMISCREQEISSADPEGSIRMHYKSSRELKADARVSMLGHMSLAVGSMILYMILVLVITEITSFSLPHNMAAAILISVLVNFLVSVIVGIIHIGLKSIYLEMLFGNHPKIFALFRFYRESANSAVVISGFFGLLDTLVSIPCVILLLNTEGNGFAIFTPALILAFLFRSLGQFLVRIFFFPAPYLLMDFPQMQPSAMLRSAAKLMENRRKDYILLNLSFLPLHLLGLMSMGIGSFWVMAYQECACAAFYKDMITARQKTRNTA